MAIKVGGTTVVDDSRGLTNIATVDATTAAAISAAGVGGGGEHDFVASGAISNGDVVILNSDGTVSVVAETSGTETVGTATNFKTGEATYISAVYDANSGKVVVIYRDQTNSGYGTAVVGTISGTSISFGTPVVFESASVFYVSSTYDSNAQKVVIAYRDAGNSDYGTAIVGTVSGTSISFGTASVFNSGSTNHTACTFDTSNNKVVIAYQDTGNSSQGTAIVGTVSSTSISFGTEVVFKNSSSDRIECTFDSSNNKVVIVYKNSSNGLAIVGTVSGTSISFGTEVTFHTGGTYSLGNVTFDSSNNKIVIAYRASGFDLIVGTVSGTSISFGSATSVTLPSFATITNVGIGFDTQINKSVIVLDDFGNSKGYVFTATVSGTSISATSLTEWLANRGTYPSLAYDTGNQKFGLFYYNSTSPTNSFGRTYKSAYTITNAADYIGVAAEAISDTATGAVTIDGGVNEVTLDNYDLANASYANVSFSLGGQIPEDVHFKSDGTKMYTLGASTDSVYEYTLSTAWDITTASFVQTFSVSSQESDATGLFFKPDGTAFFIIGSVGDDVNEYSLSTAWDISTASFSQNFSVNTQDTSPADVHFKSDGTKMYVLGRNGRDVNEYNLSTAWDISTASYSQNFSVSSQMSLPQSFDFKPDGTKMYVTGNVQDTVNEYSLSTAWDISTASYVQNFSVATQDGVPKGLFFGDSGIKMYIVGGATASILQYTTGTFGGYTVNDTLFVADDGSLSTTNNGRKIGRAISTTKLLVDSAMSGDEMNAYLGSLV